MEYKDYQPGDEGNSRLELFNSSILYELDETVTSVWDHNQVIAFLDCDFNDATKTLLLTAFETLIKGQDYGKRIISDLKSDEDIQTIIIQPLEGSKQFWLKMGFEPCSNEEWIWERQRTLLGYGDNQ